MASEQNPQDGANFYGCSGGKDGRGMARHSSICKDAKSGSFLPHFLQDSLGPDLLQGLESRNDKILKHLAPSDF